MWAIERDIIESEILADLTSFMSRAGIEYKLVCSEAGAKRVLTMEKIDTEGTVIALGSYDYVYRALELGWEPGAWYNRNFDWRIWSASGWDTLNNDGVICRFEDLQLEEPRFVRPLFDDKVFNGQVMGREKHQKWLRALDARDKLSDTYLLTRDALVVSASVKHISQEYRVLVVAGEPVTASLYKFDSIVLRENADSDSRLFDFAREQVARWSPADAFVLDVAVYDGEFVVLEMGCINCAGLYHCDVQKMVTAIEELVR